jgi:hypothetical protein
MIKFPDRRMIVEKVITIIKPEHTVFDIDNAMVTWWQNIRSTGGFGLTYAGSKAFESAQIEYQEFDDGESSYMGNVGMATGLDRKMTTPYYFYNDQRRQKIKIYDGRIAMLVSLHESVSAYLKTIDDRPVYK